MFFYQGRWRVCSHFEIEPDVPTEERDNFTLFRGAVELCAHELLQSVLRAQGWMKH